MLTDEQKKRITEMRLEGMGYQAIANALGDGVEKGNVRYFCKTRVRIPLERNSLHASAGRLSAPNGKFFKLHWITHVLAI